MFENWSELYKEFLDINPGKATNDQPFFRAAAYYGDARVATLGREYNCKFRGQGYLNGPVKLLHGHVKFKMKADYMRKVAGVMNASEKPRVYIGGKVYDRGLMRRLLAYMWPYRAYVAVSLVLLGINSVAQIAGPPLMKTVPYVRA